MVIHIGEEMARGNAVTVIPVHEKLTAQEAAGMLNIPRPSLIQLLDEGKSNSGESVGIALFDWKH